MDFKCRSFQKILEAGQAAQYQFCTVNTLFETQPVSPLIVLRHDVDRLPANALKMAKMEAEMGVSASYYFRSVPVSFSEKIILEIHEMGHEIGYHYEDWFLAKYDSEKAIGLFSDNLQRLRDLVPVKTICMHGSPLAKENNMTIWKHFDFTAYGVKDCILSQDYSDFAFFTDSGRTFGQSRANLRDELNGALDFPCIKSSVDLTGFLQERGHDKVMISCHPERWSDDIVPWSTQFAKDQMINMAKRAIRLVRQ